MYMRENLGQLTAVSPDKWMKIVLGANPEWICIRSFFDAGL